MEDFLNLPFPDNDATIIFGLGIDSLLTLVIVPVIYSIVEKPGPLPARKARQGRGAKLTTQGR